MKKILALLFVFVIFPVSTILADTTLILGGDSIGVEANYEGVYVSGTYQFNIDEELIKPEEKIHPKDLIIKIGTNNIEDLSSFKDLVATYDKVRNEIPITMIRNDKLLETILVTKNTTEGIEHGLYLKEKVLGIGTLTFYNPEEKRYGALGHSISEENNENLQTGNIYDANISSVKKAEKNNPGEKNGDINFENEIGDIEKNINFGIYGKYYLNVVGKETLPTAEIDEIKLGEAKFYTTINGNNIESFNIEITGVNKNDLKSEKAISFSVKDQALIDKCGGIIHGMSGSPIVQNGKIIGAITHVKVDDPLSGYAVFIMNMVNETSN